MSESFYRCVDCKSDVRFGDYHCRLCHKTFPKCIQHSCEVVDAVLTREKTTNFSDYTDDFEDALRSDPNYPRGMYHYEKHIFGKVECDCSRELFASSAFQLGSIEAEASRILSIDDPVNAAVIMTSHFGKYKRALNIAEDSKRETRTRFHGRPSEPISFHHSDVPSGE